MKKILTSALLLTSMASLAFADRAEVLSVDEVMTTYTQRVPYENCYFEELPIYADGADKSYTNEIVGGILGGVIGNQLGHRRAKPVMTAAGTLLGASIAHDADRSHSQEVVGYRQVQRCETKYKQEEKQRLDHYLVSAVYNGKKFIFKTSTKPEETIKVRISPIHE